MENGLPQNTVTALVQTTDGFVWLGTEVGLVRFDGYGFQVFDNNTNPALPANDVCCLLETRDGSLWIGTGEGLARWKDGKVRNYSTRDGLPGNAIRALSLQDNGLLSVDTGVGKGRLSGDTFVQVAQLAGNSSRQGAERAGLPKDAVEFEATLGGGQSALASKNLVVIMRGDHVVERLSEGKDLPGTRIQALLADREGSLWIGTNGGLARLAGGKIEVLSVTDSLASASILALMEDREGNVWIGTESAGLHILRDLRFRTIDTRDGLSSDATTAVVEDAGGRLWVGTQGAGLNTMRREASSVTRIRSWTSRDGLMSDVILSLASAPNGDVWVGTPDGLNRIRGGRVDAFTSADGLPDDFIRSLLVDRDGSLWIGTRRGLVHWPKSAGEARGSTAGMEILTRARGLGSDTVGAMARDVTGDLWVATFAGLSRLRGGMITNYTISNGLSSNVVTALSPQKNGQLLVGTQDHGWDVWDGQKFSRSAGNGLPFAPIHAILDDALGHLWFATGNGIVRCDCDGAGSPGGDPHHSVWTEFGTADGLRSRETATNSHPSAIRSKDGLLWFATPKGLVEVDPAHFPINTVAPPVALERFVVDDVDQPLSASHPLELAAGHVHFQFDYAGLSFTAPLKVRYRYRLEGFDQKWTEAGARRAAYYTNIPPGHYTIRVQAANNDGLWNTTGDAFSFELKPHFYQTVWFYALLLLAMAAGIFLLLKRRLRTAEHEFQAVLGERSRIAREIHDTLAQGYVGISVQLEMLDQLWRQNKTETAAKQLAMMREYVREGLADARQSIWALRTQDSRETTLPVRIRRLVEAAQDRNLATEFTLFGAFRPLTAEKEQELLRIAQEAIHNVKKHAGARRLSVELSYSRDTIELEVRDDGKGGAMDGNYAPAHGSFGLTGMRERAAALGGKLEVESAAGEGTIVRLLAPAPAASREQTGESS